MDKTYKSVVIARAAKPRSKALAGRGYSATEIAAITQGPDLAMVEDAAARLTQDIVPDTGAGHIASGDRLEMGMTFTQFVKKLFCHSLAATLTGRISTPNDVEYGALKGVLTYTATRNANGPMLQAYMDHDDTKPLVFSDETDGAQIAVRQLEGLYTENETYNATVVFAPGENEEETPELTLNHKVSVNVHRRWFAGVCAAAPTTSAQVRALPGSGLYAGAGSYKFGVGRWKTIALCVPEGVVTDISVGTYPGNFVEDTRVCSGPVTISVEGANGAAPIDYKMWVIQTEMENDQDTFTFKTI